ncbi:methyltransferase domain-containing protein [Shewanella zhangzhouensis]|uniref:methyltransferase domain-containing protein n=1 Tax=Shewanella zhangzhouensis TaxID=2864213 RepID=UPI001C65BD1B|nr:methyltransferase domain-containing protein [Shewanella zhangzhouensis]QYK05907.1 methyltransferase domain-containing protein [Shewanella zhangzhouensis]
MTLTPSPIFDAYPELFTQTKPLKVLDLACGNGRNGIWFLERGHHVSFVDLETTALPSEIQGNPGASIHPFDLEQGRAPLLGPFDVILVFNYLHRPLMPWIRDSVLPGGILVYETFTEAQASIGRPKNPAFLLGKNELRERFTDWEQVYYREDTPETPGGSGAYKASIICRKPLD